MSNEEKELGLFIVNHRDDDFASRPFDHCQDLICDTPGGSFKTKHRVLELLKYMNDRSTLVRVEEWTPPRFPVRGEDVLDAGVPKGRAVGKVLSFLQQKWKESRYVAGTKELLEFVEEAKRTVL
jgi:tRNA nucleotidyltransferase (CCA-adding enzyme)